jgi:DNA-binding GntR family transcriptional regulator
MPVKMPDLEAATARSFEFLRAGGFAKKKSDPAMRPEQRHSQIHDAVIKLAATNTEAVARHMRRHVSHATKAVKDRVEAPTAAGLIGIV